LRVPGVANVAIWGERLKMLQVQADPERMGGNGVSLDEVMETTADAVDAGLLRYSEGAVIGTGGYLDTANQRLVIRHVPPVLTPAALARVPLKEHPALHLSDVANVLEDHQPLVGDAVVNDQPGLLLVVDKFPWANTLETTHGLEQALDELRPALTGVQIDANIFRPATFIDMSIDNLTRALIIGSLLVVVILIAFLFEWRTALISLVAMPLSLMVALLVLHQMGATINVMVLAGLVIAIGVVVDDAIIDVENIWRRLRQQRLKGQEKSTAATILDASLEVRSAIVHATLMDLVVLMPVFFLEGLTGSFFRPLALSFVLAVLASMLVALTVTPALALILLSKAPLHGREPPLRRWLQAGYASVLRRIIRRPAAAYVSVATVVLVGLIVAPQLGEEFLPTFKERDFLTHWITAPGTSHPEEARITTEGTEALRAIPGVQTVGAHIGQAFLAEEVVGVNFGENWISVDPDADYDPTIAAIEETVGTYPGLLHEVETYLKETTEEVLTGTSQPIVVRINGPDLPVLREKADEVEEALSHIDGIDELHKDLQVDVPQVQVKVDLDKAQHYGVKPGDVRRAAGVLVSSEEVADIYQGGKTYEVQVWSTPKTRENLGSIEELLIDTPTGGHVRLGDIAEIRVAPTPNVVQRENQSRRIDVLAGVKGRDLGSVSRDVQSALSEIEFPLGYHAEMLGEFNERQQAQGRLLLFGVGSAIGVLLLLGAAFGNWKLAILSFLTLPSALVGGVLAAYAGDGVISLGSLVGFLTVFGIAARNGIMLISHFQYLEDHEGESFGPDLVLRGARERIAPILMTASAAALALVPLVVAGSIPGNEIEHPMAVVILGGLVTSTLLNLFIVPSLYLQFGRRARRSVRTV
jgi:CzcA family heavy metal efflux pump